MALAELLGRLINPVFLCACVWPGLWVIQDLAKLNYLFFDWTLRNVNNDIMEMLIMAYACRTSSARNIVGVIPYLPYSKQSTMRKRGCIVSKLLAQMICKSGLILLCSSASYTMIDWVIDWMIDWQIDWVIDGLGDWLSDRLSDRLIDGVINWVIGIFCVIRWSILPIDRLIWCDRF